MPPTSAHRSNPVLFSPLRPRGAKSPLYPCRLLPSSVLLGLCQHEDARAGALEKGGILVSGCVCAYAAESLSVYRNIAFAFTLGVMPQFPSYFRN